ncbi:MAG: hypothetical protein QXQ40_02100 [Candidatus Aenigmatarchaeota archaeon]
MVEITRMTAIKTDIKSVISGKFLKQDGLTPSYVLTNLGQKLSRIRILATVVDKFISSDEQYGTITLDDNTGTIRAKEFKYISNLKSVEKGDLVDVIGKIRIYNDEVYIIPEIIYKVEDPNLLTLRRLELKNQEKELKRKYDIIIDCQKKTTDLSELKRLAMRKFKIKPEEIEAVLLSQEVLPEQSPEEDIAERKEEIIKLIEKLDSGSGCEYSSIIKESGLSEDVVEKIINELLNDGVCFEPKPGIIKLL